MQKTGGMALQCVEYCSVSTDVYQRSFFVHNVNVQ